MPESCTFPLCKYPQDRGGYCIHHAKHFSGAKVADKPKPISRESEKRKKLNKEYKAIVKKELGSGKKCEVKSPVCTGKAQGMNHIQKRSAKNLIEKTNLTPCCNACNMYIEEHPCWAKENGHSKSRFEKI